MVNYKDLGLVNTRDMFAKAIKGGYGMLVNFFSSPNNVIMLSIYSGVVS